VTASLDEDVKTLHEVMSGPVLVERAPDKTSPMSFMPIFRLDGAFAQVGEQDATFGATRTPQYAMNIEAISPDPAALAADRSWVPSVWAALRPLTASAGGYVNFDTEPGDDRMRASYGPTKYDRLALIKTRYDPANVFHRNANITPAQPRPIATDPRNSYPPRTGETGNGR
jgi:hypothetical protein